MSAWVMVDYFEEIVRDYKESVMEAALTGDSVEVSRLLARMAREVNKDTRHKAADMAMKLHNDLVNLSLDELR